MTHLQYFNEVALQMSSEQEMAQLQQMTNIFNSMDVNKNGSICKEEFRKYVQKNPKGWPLVDLFRAKTMSQNERDLLINFIFRKLDIDGNGVVGYKEFIGMFIALRNTKKQESLYVDFLINLFDDNLDGKLDREEFTKMMHVLFGEEPPQMILDSIPVEGLDRDQMVRALHSISMDYQLLPTSFGGMQHSNSGLFTAGVTESRVWNTESGVYDLQTVSGSELPTPATSPNQANGGIFGSNNNIKKNSATSTTSSSATTKSANVKAAGMARNKQHKRDADSTSLVIVVAATAAITAGLCVFAGYYGRKAGHF